MNDLEKNISQVSSHGTFATYSFGFLFSLLLTVVPYFIVVDHLGNAGEIMVLIIGIALLQLIVQMIFFLHLNAKSKSRWNLTVFLFTILIVVIVVGGSLWIMKNLDTNMTSAELDAYMNSQN